MHVMNYVGVKNNVLKSVKYIRKSYISIGDERGGLHACQHEHACMPATGVHARRNRYTSMQPTGVHAYKQQVRMRAGNMRACMRATGEHACRQHTCKQHTCNQQVCKDASYMCTYMQRSRQVCMYPCKQQACMHTRNVCACMQTAGVHSCR